MKEESLGGYLFIDGKRIDFEKIILNKIDFKRETGALRIRVTSNEIDIDFLEEKEPTKEQLNTIEKLKKENNKKLVFEIMDKNNFPLKRYGGFNKKISEMRQQLKYFYDEINLKCQ